MLGAQNHRNDNNGIDSVPSPRYGATETNEIDDHAYESYRGTGFTFNAISDILSVLYNIIPACLFISFATHFECNELFM